MGHIRQIAFVLSLLAVFVLGGCAKAPPGGPEPANKRQIAELAQSVRALGIDIDPEEAERLARISYQYARQLAFEYQVSDPPLVHNTKVNLGLRPRGLCYQWADSRLPARRGAVAICIGSDRASGASFAARPDNKID